MPRLSASMSFSRVIEFHAGAELAEAPDAPPREKWGTAATDVDLELTPVH